MQRQRGSLVPVAEVVSGLNGPVKAIRDASPQARHHFTRFDQVNQLVGASEADADLGFMARLLALCSLPRTNPGNRLQYKRVNGPYQLYMIAGGGNKLPFGNIPRLLLAWVTTEAVRTQSRELILGSSLSEFMGKLGMDSVGGARTRLRNQMRRLFNAHVQLVYEDKLGEASVSSSVTSRTEFWWDPKQPDVPMLWDSKIELGWDFFNGDHPPPGAARHEHPHGSQALFAGPRSLPVARLPDIRAEAPATALLAASVPPVRSGPGQSQRQASRQTLPPPHPARVEENQDCLAGPELLHGSGRPDPLTLQSRHRSGAATSTRGIALVLP